MEKFKKILKLALPSASNNFLEIFVLAISIVFMGKLSDTHIVAMGVGLQYLLLFYSLNSIFFIGTNAMLSRLVGAKDLESVSVGYSSILMGAGVLCVFACVLGFIGIGFFVPWMGVSTQANALAHTYLEIFIFAMPAIFLKNVMVAALASLSDTLTPLLIKAFMSAICLFLNQALIFGDWGFVRLDIAGAAWANVIVSFLELAILFGVIAFKNTPLKFRWIFDWKFFKRTWHVGWPSGFERLLSLFSMTLVSKFVASYGDAILAGMQVGLRVETFSFMPGLGFTIACMVLVGQNLGANQVHIAQDYIRATLKVAGSLLGILGVLMVIFAKPFASVFTQNAIVIEVASWYLAAVGVSQVPLIFLFVLDGAFRGAGMAKVSLYINTLSLWSLRIIPMYILLKSAMDVRWLFVIICVETYVRAGIFYWAYRRGWWKKPGRFVS
ncbi:MATE family efflux transporter [Helicobacter salomonis]|uniref:MATE family efflux transporter n=1 Tax=Helicobacter salomonis TaxID=56878 RepID=UPI000CF124C3|nr:MATE family efflux transporter [Helicobacter salomonis]